MDSQPDSVPGIDKPIHKGEGKIEPGFNFHGSVKNVESLHVKALTWSW